jgi:hypothetical protein
MAGRDDFSYVCEATVPIKAGSEILTSYHHYYFHLFGTMYRYTSTTTSPKKKMAEQRRTGFHT